MKTLHLTLVTALMLTAPARAAQVAPDHHAALDERGAHVMGFDQKTTTHHFVLTSNGGRIEVTANDPADTGSIAQIRAHLGHLAMMFSQGNFEAPMLVHAVEPPGVGGMKAAGAEIRYTFETLPRGGRIQIATTQPDARAAVHDFLRFQIRDHGTGDPLEPSVVRSP